MVSSNENPASRQPNTASFSPETGSARRIAEAAARKWKEAQFQSIRHQSSRSSRKLSPLSPSEFAIARQAAMERVSVTRGASHMRLPSVATARHPTIEWGFSNREMPLMIATQFELLSFQSREPPRAP
jgi:hypothetical protein